ncbi:alpha/beta-hydrolase [Trametes elegans]|nr:alpha/beta-hydrolase [Trametes elegans]
MRLTTKLLGALPVAYAVGALAEQVVLEADNGGQSATVEWGPCDPVSVQNPSLSCGFMKVPLDYHNPAAGSGRLALAKIHATGERLGTMFFNPGGPGESGITTLEAFGSVLLGYTGGMYDIVSWDRRGVGSLTVPGDILCFDTVGSYNDFWDGTIELTGIEMTGDFSDPDDIAALLAQAPLLQRKYEELGARCLEQPTGKYLKYVGTAATVRDLVALADALDGPGAPVNYIGASYGTILGSWLINMFPERVGRVVLDAVIDPAALASEETTDIWFNRLLLDADKVYQGFVAGCVLAGPEGCPIAAVGHGASDVDNSIKTLLRLAHDSARRSNGTAEVTSADIRSAFFWSMWYPQTWTDLAMALKSEFSPALQTNSNENGTKRRRARTHPAGEAVSYTNAAILCSDGVDRQGTSMTDVFLNIISASKGSSELFSAFWPWSFNYCPFWPERAVERYQGHFNTTPANPILVVSNTLDPVTPRAGAESVTRVFGDNARLVLKPGFGHTSGAGPSQCLQEVVFAYVENGTLPDAYETLCEVDADFELFPGVNTQAILASLSDAKTDQ